MKPSLAQIILAYLGLALLLLGVFHKAVGLSDTFADPLVFVGSAARSFHLSCTDARRLGFTVASRLLQPPRPRGEQFSGYRLC